MDNNPTNPTPEPTFTNEEIKKQSFQEIATNTELPTEKPPETKIEEKPVEKPEVKPPEEEKLVEPSELAKEISKEVAAQLKPPEPILQDKYTAFFDKVKTEKGREPNWIELSKFLEEQAVISVEEKRKQEAELQAKQKEEENKATEAFTKRFNSQVDEELQELYDSKNLTPIKDAKNPNDQGVVERKALFQAMLDTNAQRVSEGKEPILSIARIFYGYYQKPGPVQPPGAEAPVSMGKGTPSGETGDEKELDYIKDIKKPWSFFRPQPK